MPALFMYFLNSDMSMETVNVSMEEIYESPLTDVMEICTSGVLCTSPRPGESEDTDEEIWPNLRLKI